MRRVFSTVLVLMLVLRGLLGDAMAMGMMPVGSADSVGHHATALATTEQGLLDHQDMMEHHADHAAEMINTVAAADHCVSADEPALQQCGANGQHHTQSCSACDICNSSLHAPSEVVLATQPAPQSQLVAPTSRFDSALTAQVVKPPIS